MAGINFSSFFGGGGSNFYSDYASIRNGSYKKLMRSYYAQYGPKAQTKSGNSSSGSGRNVLDRILEEKRNPTVSKSVASANASLNSGVSSLKSAINKLQNNDTYSDDQGADVGENVRSALKDYVSSYNATVKASKQSSNAATSSHVSDMMKETSANADKLKEIGIHVNGDGTLMLDETKAKTAKSYLTKDLFSAEDSHSYGAKVMNHLNGAAIYSNRSNTTTKTKEATKTDVAAKDASQSSTDLKSDIEALTGDKLFATTTEKDEEGNETEKYDVDAISKRVSSFVKNYNDLISSARLLGNEGVASNLKNLLTKTTENKDALKEIGVNPDKNGNLTLDEKKLKASDMEAAKKTLKNYAKAIETSSSLVKYYATTNANTSNGYNSTGAYNTLANSSYTGII